MIERLLVLDFQCHKRLRIDFDSQVTAIVGPSDVGKSSVIRALRWLATNRPRGDSFIRWGENRTKVKLRVDGVDITRVRGGGQNSYKVGDYQAEAFGTDVPDRVSQLLNLVPVNFSGQHDAPFWFSLTPGEVAKQLNAIVDLDSIDKTMAELSRRLRDVRAVREVTEGQLATAKEEQEQLAFVPQLVKEHNRIQALEKQLIGKRRKTACLSGLVGEVGDAGVRAKRLLQAKTRALSAVKTGERVLGIINRAKRLGDLIRVIKEAKAKVGLKIPDLKRLETLKRKAEVSSGKLWMLKRLLGEYKLAEQLVKKKMVEANRAARELKREMGGVCPLCGGKV